MVGAGEGDDEGHGNIEKHGSGLIQLTTDAPTEIVHAFERDWYAGIEVTNKVTMIRLESDRDKIFMRNNKGQMNGSGIEMISTSLFPETNIFRQFC